MRIESQLTKSSGEVIDVVYTDIENENELESKIIQGVHAFCFYGDKLVIVYSKKKDNWSPPGGVVEDGENILTAIQRELKEESNMKLLKHRILGYQEIRESDRITTQTRSVCTVEPYGSFVGDPDGEITEIKLIDPEDYKKYFDWGEIGDHIIQRSLELKTQMM